MCSRDSFFSIKLGLGATLTLGVLFCPFYRATATAPATCVTGAWSDPTYRPATKPPGRNQAIWMRGVSTNLVFTPDPGSWVESANGTAQLTGSASSLTNMTSGFVVT